MGTGDFFSLVETDTVAIAVIAAQLADDLFGLAMLCRCHAIERTVRFSFNRYECVLDNSDPSFLFSGMKKPRPSFQTCAAHASI